MHKLLRLISILGVISSALVLYILYAVQTPGEQLAAMAASANNASITMAQSMISPMASPMPLTSHPLMATTESPAQSPDVTSTPTITPTPTITRTPYPTRTPTSTPVVYGPEDFPFGINPLTGLQVDDPSLLDRRPIAVKIVNYPRTVRSQWGLAQADIVFEYYIERGLTRYIAIIYGQDVERVGPIRSGRYFDEHIFRMYQSYFVFASADDTVLDYFLEFDREIVNRFVLQREDNFEPNCVNQVDRPLCRDVSIHSWNNLFVNTLILDQFLTDRGSANNSPDLSGMYFDSRVPANGSEGSILDLYFSPLIYNRWDYDPDIEQYLRYQEAHADLGGKGEAYDPLLDPADDKQVAIDNIVLLYVPHESVKTEPEVVKIHLLGYGSAYVFRNGNIYEAYWVRPSEGIFILFAPNGDHFPLKPGRTFIEVVGRTSDFISEDGHWRLEFAMP